MMKDNEHDGPPKMSELVIVVADLVTNFQDHLKRAIAIGIQDTTFQDHLIIAALRRAIDNVQGMVCMMDQRNLFCGMPIVRFQIDTAMTLYGRRLVKDVDDYVTHMMKGNERREYLDTSGKRMTDGYLHRHLTGEHEFTSELYSETCAFVHFSTHHLHRVLDLDLWQQTGELKFCSHEEIVAGWPDEHRRGALTVFVYASGIILDECDRWMNERFKTG